MHVSFADNNRLITVNTPNGITFESGNPPDFE